MVAILVPFETEDPQDPKTQSFRVRAGFAVWGQRVWSLGFRGEGSGFIWGFQIQEQNFADPK